MAKNNKKGCLITFWAVIAVAVIAAMFGGKGEPAKATDPLTPEERQAAKERRKAEAAEKAASEAAAAGRSRESNIKRTLASDAKDQVEALLKAPSTAKFPWIMSDYVRKLPNGLYAVISYVDAQNAFGAMLRSNFTLIYAVEGNDYQCVEITFGDEYHAGNAEEYIRKKEEARVIAEYSGVVEKQKQETAEAQKAELEAQAAARAAAEKQASEAAAAAFEKYGHLKAGEKLPTLSISGRDYTDVEILGNEGRTLKIKHAKGVDFVGY